jgi:hypothetical protein
MINRYRLLASWVTLLMEPWMSVVFSGSLMVNTCLDVAKKHGADFRSISCRASIRFALIAMAGWSINTIGRHGDVDKPLRSKVGAGYWKGLRGSAACKCLTAPRNHNNPKFTRSSLGMENGPRFRWSNGDMSDG